MTNQTMSVELRDKLDALVCAAMGAGFVCLNLAGQDRESEAYYMMDMLGDVLVRAAADVQEELGRTEP